MDVGLAMDESAGLIEVCRLRYVGRDDRIVLANFRDAVHLDCEQNRNPLLIEFSRQENGLRTTPTMSVKNDAGALFLIRC